MPFLLLVGLILIHEVGHFFTAFLLGIEVDKIYLYPFGGISKFNISFNELLWKEFLILVMGPVMQVVGYISITHISYFSSYFDLIRIYHYSILFFNLLPIYPLDGGKLLNLLLSYRFSFKKSFLISIFFSYFTVFLFSVYFLYKDFSLNIIIVISFLIYKVRVEFKQKDYMMDRFLLERYLYNFHFKRRKNISNVDDFMRNCNHLVKKNGKYYTEKAILSKKFKNKC